MLSKLRNILKDCWKELLIITSISIILSLLFLLLFNLQPNKKIITNNIAKKNKKIFTSEFNHEFISDNERIIIVKNEDIINRKIILDLNDPKISRIKILITNQELLKSIDINLFVYDNNKNEYIINNNNFLNSNLLEYNMYNTKNERIELSYKDDPEINSLKTEDLVFIKISYSYAE
jgi:hypothetical protein